jgi:hypothetical protein
MDYWQIAGLIYLGGAIVGLIATDARPVGRVTLAALWPIGPLAFVLTVTMLIVVAPVALIGRGR